MSKYFECGLRHRASITPDTSITSSEIDEISSSDEDKKKLHDQIMEILRTVSLSLGLKKDQRLLAEYLIRNRAEVEKLIIYYFVGKEPVKATTLSEYLKTKEQLRALGSDNGPEEE